MIENFKIVLKTYPLIFNLFKKIKTITLFIVIYILKLFNIFRKKNCNKDSIRCEYEISNIHYKYTSLGDNTPICCLTHLYEITRDIVKIFNDHNIEYFIMYGTLLGQVRHKQTFIPWDTDVDIVVMKNDKDYALLLLKKLESLYDLVESDNILKINYSKINKLHVDIYFFDDEDDMLIDTLNDYWIKGRVKKSDVYPLVFSKLYDLDVKIPKNSIEVLKTTYGKDCLDKGFKKYSSQSKSVECFESSKIDKKFLCTKI